MGKKLEVRSKEFNLLPKDLKGFKEFLAEVPDTAKFIIDTREDGVFFQTYWIGVNKEETTITDEIYEVTLPHICVYGKYAHDLITELNPKPGVPFRLIATDTIDLSRGFVHIIVRAIAECNPPYVVFDGWVKEHFKMLEEAAYKYRVPLQDSKANNFL